MNLDKCNIGYIILVAVIIFSFLLMAFSVELAGLAALIAFIAIIMLVLHMVACGGEES